MTEESEMAKFNRMNPTFGPGCCSNNELPKETKEYLEKEAKQLIDRLDRYKDLKSNVFTCVGCGIEVKGHLKAFSDGMGYGMRTVCNKKVVMCQDCMKEIAHLAVDL